MGAFRGFMRPNALRGVAFPHLPRTMTFTRPRRGWRILVPSQRGLAILIVAVAALTTLIAWEMRTSTLQSRWFSRYSAKLHWEMQDGACATPIQAPSGPYDRRLGYSQLSELTRKLTARDFVVARQACPSPELLQLAQRGIAPPYDEKLSGTLHILDRVGNDLYRAPLDRYRFTEYTEIPTLLVESLLFIENRQLLDLDRAELNPAVEWDRLLLAGANYAADKVTRGHGRSMGGSTLATQMEKFRHSPEGRTTGGGDKMRQIVAASLRAYRTGPDTRGLRREIVLDYLNSIPLGGAMHEGEIVGLGHGMWVWFAKDTGRLVHDLTLPEDDVHLRRKAETYKQTLALVMATRRPTLYLQQDRAQLEDRIQAFLPLLVQAGIVSQRLADVVKPLPLRFSKQIPARDKVLFVDRKATNAVRTELMDLLEVKKLYELDRYDLRVETCIDAPVQEKVTATLRRLWDRDFLARHGFYGERLLQPENDPTKVIYSFSLYERTPDGNRLRVHADNLEKPLDINSNVKLELGSTAKLRTMANYLMVVASLVERFQKSPVEALASAEQAARDPITRWTAQYMQHNRGEGLEKVLQASLDRPFSTDPHERFFTGRGMHTFANFDDEVAGLIPLRTAFQHSVNLPYIRLMRELTQYYTAEANFDQRAILADMKNVQRKELLEAAMEQESRDLLERYLQSYAKLDYDAAAFKMCGKTGIKRFSIFHLSENPDATLTELREETRRIYPDMPAAQDSMLRTYHKQYAGKRLSRQDQAFLLGRNQVEVWVVRDRRDHPEPRFSEALQRSREVRDEISQWIYTSRHRDAQNLRLRTELERRAFMGVHKAWKRLGFPFESMVPSLATAIGSSGDRPQALAELVGIIQNEGRRVPFLRVDALHFAESTPYETHFEPRGGQGEQVMQPEVAMALRTLMHSVVEGGTARRVNGVLKLDGGDLVKIGGKTGSGDNRYERVRADGTILSSRAINRTASFVFVAGESFFGMISAHVPGEEAGQYTFTSTLALQAFRALAPAVEPLVSDSEARHAAVKAAMSRAAAAARVAAATDGSGDVGQNAPSVAVTPPASGSKQITRVALPASQVAARP